MSKVQKIPDEQLSKLHAIADRYAQLTADIGRGAVKNLLLQSELDETNKEIENLKLKYKESIEEEKKVHSELLAKYGQGQVNIETGEFISEETSV